MPLIVCSVCRINTLPNDGKCQHCGNPIKLSIWKRRMRKREAYGILLIATGLALIGLLKPAALAVMLVGTGMIAAGFVRPRVRY